MNTTYSTICDRIREKCGRENWYGPALRHPMLRPAVRAEDRRRMTFEYATATEQQIRMTEIVLGYPLPPMLKALYTQVANGGFGPDYGIHGALGGFEPTIVDTYLWKRESSTFINLAQYEGAWTSNLDTYLELPHTLWPEQFLPFSEQGCARETCLDVVTGKLFTVAPFSNETYGIRYLASSIEDWLENWLRESSL